MKTVKHNVVKIKNPNTQEWEGLPALVGESAYQIAVRLGTFTGTEEEWNNYVKENVERAGQYADAMEGAVNGTIINDTEESNITTYSSQKVNAELKKKATYFGDVASVEEDGSLNSGEIIVIMGDTKKGDGEGGIYVYNDGIREKISMLDYTENKYVFDFTVYDGTYFGMEMEDIIKNAGKMGFAETQLCININSSGYVGDFVDIISYIELCKMVNMPVKTLKIHTNNSFSLDTEENRMFYSNTLASLIKDIDPNHEIDTLYVMNEKESIYSTYSEYVNSLITTYKANYRVGVTFVNQINVLSAINSGSVVPNCDVIGINLYPAISVQNVSKAMLQESEIAWNMLTGRLQKIYDYCNENEIELQCTETGCIPYEGILSAPWYWDITNTDFVGKQNFNAIKIFLHGLINNVQVKNYFTKIGFWFVEEYYCKFSWTRKWFRGITKGDFVDDR